MKTSTATIIGHVELRITDLEISLTFYQKLLGLRLIQAEDDKAFLSASGSFPAQIILSLLPNAIEKPYRTTGLYHIAIRVPNRRELALILKRLLDHNISLLGLSDHNVSEAIYLSDPDDNGIEIYCDRPASLWSYNDSEINMNTKHLSPKDLFKELDNNSLWNGISPETVIGHIHLQVADLELSERFYHDIIGLKVTQRQYPGSLFFANENYHHHVACNIWSSKNASPPPAGTVGLEEFSIILKNQEALKAVIIKAKAGGFITLDDINIENITSIRIKDPSNTNILLTI